MGQIWLLGGDRMLGRKVRSVADLRQAVESGLPVKSLDRRTSSPAGTRPDRRKPRQHGDLWLEERRSAVLIVPAVTERPVGRNLLINPDHPDAGRIQVAEPFPVPWDDRIF
jgi:RES domain-containing protein